MIKIDKNIPIPGEGLQLPLIYMEIGDSFFVPCKNAKEYSKAREKIYNKIITEKRRHKLNNTYTVRKVDGGIRTWRVK